VILVVQEMAFEKNMFGISDRQRERERKKEKTNKGTVPTGFFCIAFFSTGYLCVDKL
jgi:hypothetical protein